jgi:hypothetical protein
VHGVKEISGQVSNRVFLGELGGVAGVELDVEQKTP